MATQSIKTPEHAIEEGRQHYAAKRFKPALEQFTRAMKLCPCYRGTKRDRCSCKNYEKVVLESGSIFKEAMYNCTCPVGKTFNKCDLESHIKALDYRAATFEAMQEFDRARRDAEWILELAPRLPDGYLRLGKISRLEKKYEMAWAIYNAGIEVGISNRLAGPKLQKLYAARQPLQLRFCRKDPLRNPQEIVHRIFSYLDLPSLVRCLRVSKEWRQYLTGGGNERLWRALIFMKTFPRKNAPSVNAIKTLVSYSGNDIRELNIEDVIRFQLTQPKLLALVKGSKNLQFLTLRRSLEGELWIPERPGYLDKLTHLVLDDFACGRGHLVEPLMRNSAATLQHLHITGLPRSHEDLGVPYMPSLKYLRLEEQDFPFPLRITIFRIASNTPNLEQLWLAEMRIVSDLPMEKVDELWKNLKVIVMGGAANSDPPTTDAIKQLASIRRGSGLQHIGLDLCWNYSRGGPFDPRMPSDILNQGSAAVSAAQQLGLNHYTNLQSLRIAGTVIPPSDLEQVIADVLRDGKLHTLDLVFPLEPHDSPLGQANSWHLEGHSWLRGAPSIRRLGIYDFRFDKYSKINSELTLLTFIASFPNLETLEIKSLGYDSKEFSTIIGAILRVTKLKRIYQTTLKGVVMDEMMALANEMGVELICSERPKQWPVELEE